MSHIALYRSWRPQTFKDMVGQKHIIQTLQNALKEGRMSHAYLFSGPRGTGKTSAAKVLAKAVNCEQAPTDEPCNECPSCRGISAGAVMDIVEIDAASNRGVEEIRDIRDKVKYAPTEVRKKVYIIDEVHMLTTEAFNALLKTLEEPPEHVLFVLATTEPHRIPATIISRCQRFDFRRVPMEDQVRRLQLICREEGISAEPEALRMIARLSDGGMRDALSLLDQVISFAGREITCQSVMEVTGGMDSERFAELARAVREQNVAGVLEAVEQLMLDGKSADRCLENLIQYYRDLLVVKMIPDSPLVSERIPDAKRCAELAAVYDSERIFSILDILTHYQAEMKYAAQPQILLEMALMKICTLEPDAPGGKREQTAPQADVLAALNRLAARVETLEKRLEESAASGGSASAGAAPLSGAYGAPAPAAGKPSPAASGRAKPAAGRIPAARMEQYARSADSAPFAQVRGKWPTVLQQVKEKKITVHAWLVDGEPVSALEDGVLVAFKNTIHRETTEKPANKQLIEQVLKEVMGRPLKLETVMQKEWMGVRTASSGGGEAAGPLQPEAEDAGEEEPEWVSAAIELFGEDMVTIKEE